MIRRKRKNIMDKTFYKCVESLEWLADKLGITYEELNVIIFVIGYPIVTIGLITAYFKK
ncbi:MAG: hypothetical protein WAR79_01010 [Melioribacteraceae bacterium]